MKNNQRYIEQQILNRVNYERRKAGRNKLAPDTGLRKLARQHSGVMAHKGHIWHGNNVKIAYKYVTYRAPKWVNFIVTGFRVLSGPQGHAGENVALMHKGRIHGYKRPIKTDNDVGYALHKNWMGSKGHRANILSDNFSRIGIGVVKKGNGYYATQVFYG